MRRFPLGVRTILCIIGMWLCESDLIPDDEFQDDRVGKGMVQFVLGMRLALVSRTAHDVKWFLSYALLVTL